MTFKLTLNAAQQVLGNAPLGILLLDEKQQVLGDNPVLQQLFELKTELTGKTAADLSPALREYLFAPQDIIHLTLPGSKERWLQCWDAPLNLEQGVTGRIRYFIDITEQKQAQLERNRLSEELERISTRDTVTQLPNRRALMQALEPLVSRSRRYSNPLSVIRLRLTQPTKADSAEALGIRDKALMAVSHMLRDQMRWADLIGRFDDDELLLVLPETTEVSAQQLITKLCYLVGDVDVRDTQQNRIALGTQFGVAGWIQGDDAQRMLRRAGQAMNEADICATRPG